MEFHTLQCCSRKKSVSVRKKKEIFGKEDAVPFYKLFRFASSTDVTLMAVSVMACVVHGMCLPIAVIIYGDLATVIVDATAPGWNSTNIVNTTQCQYSSKLGGSNSVKYNLHFKF